MAHVVVAIVVGNCAHRLWLRRTPHRSHHTTAAATSTPRRTQYPLGNQLIPWAQRAQRRSGGGGDGATAGGHKHTCSGPCTAGAPRTPPAAPPPPATSACNPPNIADDYCSQATAAGQANGGPQPLGRRQPPCISATATATAHRNRTPHTPRAPAHSSAARQTPTLSRPASRLQARAMSVREQLAQNDREEAAAWWPAAQSRDDYYPDPRPQL